MKTVQFIVPFSQQAAFLEESGHFARENGFSYRQRANSLSRPNEVNFVMENGKAWIIGLNPMNSEYFNVSFYENRYGESASSHALTALADQYESDILENTNVRLSGRSDSTIPMSAPRP